MPWQKITAIVRRDVLERVEQSLKQVGVRGISVTTVKGFGEYADFFRHDWLVSHARIEIFTGADRAEELAERIVRAAHTGGRGDGIVAILPVACVYRIREQRRCDPSEGVDSPRG